MSLKSYLQHFFTADFKGLIKDSTWSFAATLATSGLYMVEVMLLARYFSQELLGIYFLIISFPELIQQVLDIRVKEIMIRYLALFVGQSDKPRAMALIKFLWLFDVGIALVALLLVIIFSRIAASILLNSSNYASFMVLYAIGMLFESLDSASGPILRVFNRFDLSFSASLFTGLSRLGLMAVAMIGDWGVGGLIISRVIASVISTLVLGSLSLRVVCRQLGVSFHIPISELQPYQQEILHFALHVNISSTLKILITKLDVMIVGFFLGNASVAVYKISTQLAKTLLLFSDPLATAVYPRFALLQSQQKINVVNKLAKQLTIVMVSFVVPLLIGVFLFRQPLLRAFAGNNYQHNTMPFVYATWGIAFALVFFWVRPYALSLGLAAMLTKSLLISTLCSLLGLIILTKLFREQGAAIGFGLFYSLTAIFQAIQIRFWDRPFKLSSLSSSPKVTVEK